ncbi:MAG: hypothetical protein PWP65_1568 [Clostridia bacterium]|nr:hypothetical protein [Clostridia bacterium]
MFIKSAVRSWTGEMSSARIDHQYIAAELSEQFLKNSNPNSTRRSLWVTITLGYPQFSLGEACFGLKARFFPRAIAKPNEAESLRPPEGMRPSAGN